MTKQMEKQIMSDDGKKLEKALNELVGAMYRDLHGAYGGADYEGEYEAEIKSVVEAFGERTRSRNQKCC